MKNVWKTVILGGLAAGALVAGCAGPTGTVGRGAELITCTPGMNVTIGCGAAGLGTCDGDPILTVCDGATTQPLNCESAGSLGRNDDYAAPDRCPAVTVVCPTSGSLAVKPTAFSGVPSCTWATRESGV